MKLGFLRHVRTENNICNITQGAESVPCDQDSLMEFALECVDEIIDNCGHSVLILCADTLRAQQTCERLIAETGDCGKIIAVAKMQDLNEVDFGDFRGMPDDAMIAGHTMEDYRKRTIEYFSGNIENFMYPNGEQAMFITARCNRVIKEIRKFAKSKAFDEIILLGHNRLFRHLAVMLGLIPVSNMFDHKFPHGKVQYFEI